MISLLLINTDSTFRNDLERVLRKESLNWKIQSVDSTKLARDSLVENHYDVLVCDGSRYEYKDIIKILGDLGGIHPELTRVLVGARSNVDVPINTAAEGVQFLSKPCDYDELIGIASRGKALKQILSSPELCKTISKAGKLPSFPKYYGRLSELLRRDEFTIGQVTGIIKQDVAMVAKILQIANSAFFGFRRQISNIDLAVNLLGTEQIRSLVLVSEIFSKFENAKCQEFNVEGIWQHAIEVGNLSRKIAKELYFDKRGSDDAFTAGLLHDVGKLILIRDFTDEYRNSIKESRERSIPQFEAEKLILKTTHAEVGAFLLGLWSLPDSLVEAVAFHHNPTQCYSRRVSLVSIVYFANTIVHTPNDFNPASDEQLHNYLTKFGLVKRFHGWKLEHGHSTLQRASA